MKEYKPLFGPKTPGVKAIAPYEYTYKDMKLKEDGGGSIMSGGPWSWPKQSGHYTRWKITQGSQVLTIEIDGEYVSVDTLVKIIEESNTFEKPADNWRLISSIVL